MTRFDGLEECVYTVTWTRNGKGWYTAAFVGCDEAREFVAGILRENEGRCEFSWYAQRLATLASGDFLDENVPDSRVRFANSWPSAHVDEPDGPEKDLTDRIKRALLDVIEECRESACGEAASERLRAMSEAARAFAALP